MGKRRAEINNSKTTFVTVNRPQGFGAAFIGEDTFKNNLCYC